MPLSEEQIQTNCDVPGYADPLRLQSPVSVLLYLLGISWLVVGIRFLSERYFAKSIEAMIRTYHIPQGIAGATLMAAGTSAPELISSLIGVFVAKKVDTGAGTVIGSVIFNQLVIIGGIITVSPGRVRAHDSSTHCL